MGIVTGLTAARMLEIESASVVSGTISSQGRLLLATRGGVSLDAGVVVGPQGAQGFPGTPAVKTVYIGVVSASWTYGQPMVAITGQPDSVASVSPDVKNVMPGSQVLLYRTDYSPPSWVIVGVLGDSPDYLKQIELLPQTNWKSYDHQPTDPYFVNSTEEGQAINGRYGPGLVTKSAGGWVLASGLFASLTSMPAGSLVTILPDGFRPIKVMRYSCPFQTQGYTVNPNGEVRTVAAMPSGGLVSLGNLRFLYSGSRSTFGSWLNGWSDLNTGGLLDDRAQYGSDAIGWRMVQGAVTGGTATNNMMISTSPTSLTQSKPGTVRHIMTASSTGSAGLLYVADNGIAYGVIPGATNANFSLDGAFWDPTSLAVPWVEPVLMNSWTHFGGTYPRVGLTKRSDKLVALRGLMTGGALGSMGAFILPEGYRPKRRIVVAAVSAATLGRLDILPSGRVTPMTGVANSWYSLDGIMFPADH